MDKDILALISRENSGFSKGQRLIASIFWRIMIKPPL